MKMLAIDTFCTPVPMIELPLELLMRNPVNEVLLARMTESPEEELKIGKLLTQCEVLVKPK